MPAPNLLTLFAFEKQIEGAVATILHRDDVLAVRQTGQTTLSTPRREVKLFLGAPTGHRFTLPQAVRTPAQTYPDAWNAQLVVTVLTNRKTVPGNGEMHDELVAGTRVAMLQALGGLNAALTYLSVQIVNDGGVVPGIDAGADIDVSPLVFNLQFSIRRDAWPAEVTG